MKGAKNIVVVGGGAAGWLTALTLQKLFSTTQNITLIESDQIGILGAGEGVVPSFNSFLFKILKLPFYDFIKSTSATFKYCTAFKNWNGKEEFWVNAFAPTTIQHYDKVINKAPFIKDTITNRYDMVIPHAFHFDASLLAKFLKENALKRGIHRIEGKVVSFNNDTNGFIKEIVFEDGRKVNSDFVFDCSGFKRLIIGKHYNSRWICLKHRFPGKAALPFFLDIDKEYKPYTLTTAMKHGWMWKIPLQHRYGSGYIFDSDYITEDQAKEEVEQYLGHSIKPVNLFKYSPGYYEKICIKNCMAVGLSTGFSEPLDSNALGVVVTLLNTGVLSETNTFVKMLSDLNNETYKEEFNKLHLDTVNNWHSGIQVHYLTKRTDSLFWKEFRTKYKIYDSLLDLLERHKTIRLEDDPVMKDGLPPFPLFNWLTIFKNKELLNTDLYTSKQIGADIFTAENDLNDCYMEPLMDKNYFVNNITKNWGITGYEPLDLKTKRSYRLLQRFNSF